jgi:GT2 family glycosyltransferase
MTQPVSIITVTFYTGPVLFDMLKAALAQSDMRELILVNNGNPLPVFHQLEAMAAAEPRLTLISGHGNVGFATACNMGAAKATGEYLLFLNPDCVLPDGFLSNFLSESKRLPRPHVLGARVLDAHGQEQSGSRRAILTPWTAFVEVFSLYRLFPNHPHFKRFKWHEQEVPDKTIEVPAISGALVLTPKADFDGIGGFDSGYFLHVDDIDLCLRMKRAGGHVFFMPHPSVMHVGATSKVPSSFVEWHKTKSFVRYFFKNFSDTYPRFALYIVSAAVWMRFFVQRFIRLFSQEKLA